MKMRNFRVKKLPAQVANFGEGVVLRYIYITHTNTVFYIWGQ